MSPKQKGACTDPKRHVHHEGELLQQVGRVCGKRGLRLTPLRVDILRLVARSDRPGQRPLRNTHQPAIQRTTTHSR